MTPNPYELRQVSLDLLYTLRQVLLQSLDLESKMFDRDCIVRDAKVLIAKAEKLLAIK